MTVLHDKMCLLRRPRLALIAALLFAGGGAVDLLKLVNAVPNVRPNPFLPVLLVGAAVLGIYLLKIFTCAVERVILVLMLVGVLFKLVSIWEPRLFAEIAKYQLIAEAGISLSCAAICGWAALQSPNRHADRLPRNN
jgi:hypothetical protein